MPPYDPKANRPKLVPVDDDPAPVDALLGPVDDAPAVTAPVAPTRTHLSVVSPDERAPRTSVEPGAVEATASRPDIKVLLAVAATAVAVLGLILIARRSN